MCILFCLLLLAVEGYASVAGKVVNNSNNTAALRHYRVVTIIKPPFVMYDQVGDKWSGFCIDLLEAIRQLVKFEYTIEEVKDKRYGNINDRGNWNGMVKQLKNKKADIALGALSVTAERRTAIDFTIAYYDLVGISILRRKPQIETSLFKFLTALDLQVWLFVLGAFFFTSFLMWILDKYSPYSYQNNRDKYKDDDEKREFTFKECLWFCMTSLTPQGVGEVPKNLSGRLVAATWWLFGFIIIASYTANLAVDLMMTRMEKPIESLEDLDEQSAIEYAPIYKSPEYDYFRRMAEIEIKFQEIWEEMSLNDSLTALEHSKFAVWTYPVSKKYTSLFDKMTKAGFPDNMEEALQRVHHWHSSKFPNLPKTDRKFAFIGEANDIKYLTMTNCEYIQVGEEFSKKPYAIGLQRGSPLKKDFDDAIYSLLDNQTIELLKDKWWNKNPNRKYCSNDGDPNNGIIVPNIAGVFIAILVGISLACITLVFEYYYYKIKLRRQQRQRKSRDIFDPRINSVQLSLRPARTHNLALE